MSNFHTSVLLDEVIEGLNIKPGGIYIDATIGGGGHTQGIINRGGKVLGIDQDLDAITHLKKKFESEIKSGQLILARGNFGQITQIAQTHNITDVSGILFDLGVSSHQIDSSKRGFSFRRNEVLDMRMSENTTTTAEDLLNTLSQDELYEIFSKYGEEIKARAVVSAVAAARSEKRIRTTQELTEIISKVITNSGKINPSTRIFQALRIEVNDELKNLRLGLASGFKLLLPGGRMEVISFHSLEDRITKLFFLELARSGNAKILNKKPIVALKSEIETNRRSRSAKLRVLEKI